MFYKYPDIHKIYTKSKITKKNIKKVNKLYKEITRSGKISSDAEYVSSALTRIDIGILKSIYIFFKFLFKHSIAFFTF